MISFNSEKRVFTLTGRDFSYVIYINDCGVLQNAYFGACLPETDSGYFADSLCKADEPSAADLNHGMRYNSMPGELGFYGRGDFREPTVIARRHNGQRLSEFVYVTHRVFPGAPKLPGLPGVRCGDETLEILLRDKLSAVEVKLLYTVSADSGVLVRSLVLANRGDEPITLERAFSFCVDLPDSDYHLLRLEGVHMGERRPEITELGHGITRIGSTRGGSSHQMNPFVALLRPDCAEESGDCLGFGLIYSGSFALTAEHTDESLIRVQGGINDLGFEWKLMPGEEFHTPQVAIGYSGDGLGALSRIYADFYRDKIIPPAFVRKKRPIVINNWEATYFQFDNEKIFRIIDEAAELGMDTFVLDDGWFGERNDDTSSLGDWYVNEKKLEGGLDAVISHCKEKGLRFGLWFEPEMICKKSTLFEKHPEYVLGAPGIEPVYSRNQWLLDFTRKDVVDCVFDMVSQILSNHEISYVKWDMNRFMSEFYSRELPPDRQGEVAHRYTLGVYDFAERLTKTYPDVLFEGCASGGGRFDGGMLYYFPQIWTSDNTDGFDRTEIQWGTSLCYPLSSMSCHVSVCPNHQTGRTTPFNTRAAVASLGAFGYELDLSKLSVEEKEQVKGQIANYKHIQELILDGDLYRLSDPFTSDYFCELVVSKDKTKAYVVGERARVRPHDRPRRIRLKGLDENRRYLIEQLNVTASGKALMQAGVTVPYLGDFGSWMWNIKEISE